MKRKIYLSKKTLVIAEIMLLFLCVMAGIFFYILDIETIVYLAGLIFFIYITREINRLERENRMRMNNMEGLEDD